MVSRDVECRYDPEADAAYVYLVPSGPGRRVARTAFSHIELDSAAINVDFDAEGTVLGFEILGASRVLPGQLLSSSDPDDA